jgi:hypothetical protein
MDRYHITKQHPQVLLFIWTFGASRVSSASTMQIVSFLFLPCNEMKLSRASSDKSSDNILSHNSPKFKVQFVWEKLKSTIHNVNKQLLTSHHHRESPPHYAVDVQQHGSRAKIRGCLVLETNF